MNAETPTGRRVLGIGTAVVVMLAVILVLGPALTPAERHPEHPPATVMASPGEPIAAEAGMFRLDPSEMAVDPAAEGRRGVKRRTLRGYEGLRAFPGAPPRIPHELTPEEFRNQECLACHERGGFVRRFDAYAPVTPHPEKEACLQCHAVEGTARLFAGIDWRTVPWPGEGRAALEGGPPVIPHDLQMRENCLACHGGPGAVEEIRTPHPEQVSCRQCHVPAITEEPVFTRPLDGLAPSAGEGPASAAGGGDR